MECCLWIRQLIDYYNSWKRANNQARLLLIQLVFEEFKGIIGNHPNSADAWKVIQDTLDRRSVTSTIHPINQIFDFKKSASSSWNEYIMEFETLWTAVNTKTSAANRNSKQWIQSAFTDGEFKAHLLLRTLPSSLDNVVGTKDPLSYSDVRTQILELSRSDSSAGSVP